MQALGVQTEPVPGELAALAMNGRLLTDGRAETYPFRVPMAWSDRLAVLRAGLKVRRAVERYRKIAEARPGDAPGELQQRVYDFLGDQTFTQFTGRLPADADAMFRPAVTRSAAERAGPSGQGQRTVAEIRASRQGVGLCRLAAGSRSSGLEIRIGDPARSRALVPPGGQKRSGVFRKLVSWVWA